MSLLRSVAAAVVAFGCCAFALAVVDDPLSRRRALIRFAVGHMVFGAMFLIQWYAILEYWLPPAVGLAPLVVGVVLLYLAITAPGSDMSRVFPLVPAETHSGLRRFVGSEQTVARVAAFAVRGTDSARRQTGRARAAGARSARRGQAAIVRHPDGGGDGPGALRDRSGRRESGRRSGPVVGARSDDRNGNDARPAPGGAARERGARVAAEEAVRGAGLPHRRGGHVRGGDASAGHRARSRRAGGDLPGRAGIALECRPSRPGPTRQGVARLDRRAPRPGRRGRWKRDAGGSDSGRDGDGEHGGARRGSRRRLRGSQRAQPGHHRAVLGAQRDELGPSLPRSGRSGGAPS